MKPVVHLELGISQQISKKFETALMEDSGAWRNLIHEKNWSQNFVALSLLKGRGCSTTGKPTRSFATERVSLDYV